ncbi:hypothetical protein HAX54_003898 [Datura stramonium]|uniref:RING-type domain-containing protein n=1 Tax=Datura stramonium TaxID=4076 RepID=A0ABS8T7E0_DATST|nr:hypothetical protein [Datura stramonium]
MMTTTKTMRTRGSNSSTTTAAGNNRGELWKSSIKKLRKRKRKMSKTKPKADDDDSQMVKRLIANLLNDSDGSGTDPDAFDELITVSRSEIRTNVQCPICLGIIKRTRVVMGCQHRFCRECIDKSMRLGNNECPACRIHCAN